MRAATTKASATKHDGFVAPIPSCAFQYGMGIFRIKPNHYSTGRWTIFNREVGVGEVVALLQVAFASAARLRDAAPAGSVVISTHCGSGEDLVS
jgi:hypothetical protein